MGGGDDYSRQNSPVLDFHAVFKKGVIFSKKLDNFISRTFL